MFSNYFTKSFMLIVSFVLTVGVSEAASNTDDLTGSTLIISHDWDESTGVGEIHFIEGGATGGGDFIRIRKIKRNGDTLKMNIKFFLFNKGRSSQLIWVKGSPTAEVNIYDCNVNCGKTVRVKHIKSN